MKNSRFYFILLLLFIVDKTKKKLTIQNVLVIITNIVHLKGLNNGDGEI